MTVVSAPITSNFAPQKTQYVDLLKGKDRYCQVDVEETKLPLEQSPSSFRSSREGNSCRFAPHGEGVIARSAILAGGKMMPAKLEVVVDRSVSGEKLLGMPD